MADVLALMGDSSDNIPGVPGVGPKTATKLIGEYGDLETLLARAEEVKGKMGERLRDHADDARRSRDLVVLQDDVPLELDLDACRTPTDYDADALVSLFRELGFNRYIEEFDLAGTGTGGEIGVTVVETEAALRDLAEALAEQDAFAFDTETTSPRPREADLVGLSIAWSDTEGYYVPIRGPDEDRCLPLEAVREVLGPVLSGKGAGMQADERGGSPHPPREGTASGGGRGGLGRPPRGNPEKERGGYGDPPRSPSRTLVGQNLKYDRLVCLRAGIDLAEPYFDTMVAAYLANPGRRQYGLDALALDYFGHKMIPISDLLGEKKDERLMDAVPIDQVAEYAVEDAVVTWRLRGRLEAELEEKGLSDLAREVEMPLVPVLASMEETGIAVDREVLEAIAADLDGRLDALEREIYKAADREFAINSPQQLAEVLFEEQGLAPLKKTAKGKRPSTDASVLTELARRHPLPRLVLEYRSLAKLKGTYVDALPALVDPADGRIHTSFNQTATATGRRSSSDPNLQNIPIRTDEGRQIRRAFVPGEDGRLLLAADYSQIELRMLAHFSEDPALVQAFADDRDIHAFVAAQIHGVDEADVTYDMRRVAKIVNFSLIYGKTAYGLSRDLDIPVPEAEQFIDEYFARYGAVRDFTAEVLDRAEADGYVTTILGRRRPIEGIGKKDLKRLNFPERTAINTVIQGSAADLMKIAMNRIWRRLGREDRPSRLLLQIHDELIFETPEDVLDEEREWIVQEMVSAMDLRVPLTVHVATGTNWMEAE
jgi:DNA polymerase-1